MLPFFPFLLKRICVDIEPYMYVFNFSTHTGCWVHYATQIILQPCLILIDIPSFIPVFSHTPFHVDTSNPFLEDDLGERNFSAPIVIDDEGASIPLERCDLCSTELPHHPSWIVGLQSSDARNDQTWKFGSLHYYFLRLEARQYPLYVFFS